MPDDNMVNKLRQDVPLYASLLPALILYCLSIFYITFSLCHIGKKHVNGSYKLRANKRFLWLK